MINNFAKRVNEGNVNLFVQLIFELLVPSIA